MLFLTTQAVAAANGQQNGAHSTTGKNRTAKASSLGLEQKLALKVKVAHKHRGTIRFFATRRSLLRSAERRPVVVAAVARARRGLARATKEVRYYERVLEARRARRLAKAPPRVAICAVFGRYCRQALAVARCESRYQTTARNGQYLGLFQMGSQERQLSGHGDSAYEQAVAAHRYFVRSGRDWSPWSCSWAAF